MKDQSWLEGRINAAGHVLKDTMIWLEEEDDGFWLRQTSDNTEILDQLNRIVDTVDVLRKLISGEEFTAWSFYPGEPPKDNNEYLVTYDTGVNMPMLALIYWDTVYNEWRFSDECAVCGEGRPFDDEAYRITQWMRVEVE